MKVLETIITVLIIILWQTPRSRGNITLSPRPSVLATGRILGSLGSGETQFMDGSGQSDNVETPADDRLFSLPLSYGSSSSWRNGFGLFNREAPKYPINDGMYGNYGGYGNARQFQYPNPSSPQYPYYSRPLPPPTPYQYYSRPTSPPVPIWSGEQGWKATGGHPYPYQNPELEETSESYSSQYKAKPTKGRRPSSSVKYYENDDQCECANDDTDTDVDEFGCNCMLKTKERKIIMKETKPKKNKYSKPSIRKGVTRKPCKYGYNSGPNGGCKAKPTTTTPLPLELEYSEDEYYDEDFDLYPLNCAKDDLKCIQKYIYSLSSENADHEIESSHRPQPIREKIKSPYKIYSNSQRIKTETPKTTEYSDSYVRPSRGTGHNEETQDLKVEGGKHENPSDSKRTATNLVNHQKFKYDPKTGQFELQQDKDQFIAQSMVPLEASVPTTQTLKQNAYQSESLPTAKPSSTSSIQQSGSLSQLQLENPYNPQALAPLIGQLLLQGGMGMQYPTLTNAGTEFTVQSQSGNKNAYSIQPQQLIELSQGAPVSFQPQVSQLNSLSDLQVNQKNPVSSGNQHYVQPQVTIVDSIPTQQEKNPYIIQSQGTTQSSPAQTQQASNQNIYQSQGQSQNSQQYQNWEYQNSAQPQGPPRTSQYTNIQVSPIPQQTSFQQAQTQQSNYQSSAPAQQSNYQGSAPTQQPSFQSSVQSQQTNYQSSFQPEQKNYQSSIQPQTTMQNSPYFQSSDAQTSMQPQWSSQSSSFPQTQTATSYPVQSQAAAQSYSPQNQNSQSGSRYSSQQPAPETPSHYTFQPQAVSQSSYETYHQPQQFGIQNPSQQQKPQAESQSQYYSQSKTRTQNSQTSATNSPQPPPSTRYNSQSHYSKPSFTPEYVPSVQSKSKFSRPIPSNPPSTNPSHSSNYDDTRINEDEYVSFFSQEPQIISINTHDVITEQPQDIIYEPRSISQFKEHSETNSRNNKEQQQSQPFRIQYTPTHEVENNKSIPIDSPKGKTDCDLLREYHEILHDNYPPIDQIPAKLKEMNHNSYEKPTAKPKSPKKVQGRTNRKESSEKVINISPFSNYQQVHASDDLYNNVQKKVESSETSSQTKDNNFNIAIHLHQEFPNHTITTSSGQRKESIKVNANDVMDIPKVPAVYNRRGKEYSGHENLDTTLDTPVPVEDGEESKKEQPIVPQLQIEEVTPLPPQDDNKNVTVQPAVEGQVLDKGISFNTIDYESPRRSVVYGSSNNSISSYNSTVSKEAVSNVTEIALSSSAAVV